MKVLLLSIVMLASASAQQPPQPTQHLPPPPLPATPVEPKHSEATADLRAVEAEKATLQAQQQNLAEQVNSLMAGIRDKMTAKEKEAEEYEEVIRKENGWDESYTYVASQPQQDGTTVPGHWQKSPTKK